MSAKSAFFRDERPSGLVSRENKQKDPARSPDDPSQKPHDLAFNSRHLLGKPGQATAQTLPKRTIQGELEAQRAALQGHPERLERLEKIAAVLAQRSAPPERLLENLKAASIGSAHQEEINRKDGL